MPKRYILPIWGEAPSNPIITKCVLWVPLPDVINCAKFHLYHANTFGWPDPDNWMFPLTREVTFTTARALASSAVITAECCKGHLSSQWEHPFLGSGHPKSNSAIKMKFGTIDYVGEGIPQPILGNNRITGGFSPYG